MFYKEQVKKIIENEHKIGNRVNSILDSQIEQEKRLNNISNNVKTINMLTQTLCDKYSKGTFIMYDEHNPREIVIISDGKRIDMSGVISVSFSWDINEFPSLSIDRI